MDGFLVAYDVTSISSLTHAVELVTPYSFFFKKKLFFVLTSGS